MYVCGGIPRGWITDTRCEKGSNSFSLSITIVKSPEGTPLNLKFPYSSLDVMRSPRLEASWFLVKQGADDLEIEVGPDFGAHGNHRFALRFTGPDAFTLTSTIRHGVAHKNELRYVRDAGPLLGQLTHMSRSSWVVPMHHTKDTRARPKIGRPARLLDLREPAGSAHCV